MTESVFERDHDEIRVLSLFSGCGGMDFGIEAAGGQIIFANDVLAPACATLRKYFPNTEIVERKISEIEIFPKADVIVGGYPCQSFSMAGNRAPKEDGRSNLYRQFLRAVRAVQPQYFVAENVSGLKQLANGAFLNTQIKAFTAEGYRVTHHVLNAAEYGVPQVRKRLFIVGVRRDLNQKFSFPLPMYGPPENEDGLPNYMSHGDAIHGLPLWPTGEFYERTHDPEGHFSWYYMSRQRKAAWNSPSYTIVANWRHVTLHPASPSMTLTWSNLQDGWKQRWDFTGTYEHVAGNPNRPRLPAARRLSWRECALIQTFPDGFEPVGDLQAKFTQIGNAVPPLLAEVLFRHLFTASGLRKARRPKKNSFSLRVRRM